jgi:hypothetical protein
MWRRRFFSNPRLTWPIRSPIYWFYTVTIVSKTMYNLFDMTWHWIIVDYPNRKMLSKRRTKVEISSDWKCHFLLGTFYTSLSSVDNVLVIDKLDSIRSATRSFPRDDPTAVLGNDVALANLSCNKRFRPFLDSSNETWGARSSDAIVNSYMKRVTSQ